MAAGPTSIYSKIAMSAEQHLYWLWQRNLIIDDRARAARFLDHVSYFRLSVYTRLFRNPNGIFLPKTKFSDIISVYEFDRTLKLITADALERIEVGLRSSLSNDIAISKSDAHWYFSPDHFVDVVMHHNVMGKIIAGNDNKKTVILKHYYNNYAHPRLPPVWAVVERLSFGPLSWMYASLKLDQRKLIAKKWGFDEKILISWFHALTGLRNVCAHHGRIWMARFPVNTPIIPNRLSGDFGAPDSFYNLATIIYLLLKSGGMGEWWKSSLISTFSSNTKINPIIHLGFKPDWDKTKAWN